MRTVLKVAKKALPAAMIYFGIFLVLVIAFSFMADGSQEKSFQTKKMDIVVLDADESTLTKGLIAYLAKDNTVNTRVKEELLPDLMFTGVIDYIIHIENGFEERVINGVYIGDILQESIRANAAFLDQKIDMYIRYIRTELATGKTMEQAVASVKEICAEEAETELAAGHKKGFVNMPPLYYFFTYLAYALPAVLIMILGPILQEFYQRDVKMRTDCAKTSTRRQNMNIIGGMGIVAVLFWLVFEIAALVLYRDTLNLKIYAFGTLNSFLFLLVSIAIAALIGRLVKGKDALNGASNLLSMGMAFLCGIFVPGEFLPDYVQKIGEFLPAKWYMKNIKLLFDNEGISGCEDVFLKQSGVLLIFTAAIFCIILVVAKKKRTI